MVTGVPERTASGSPVDLLTCAPQLSQIRLQSFDVCVQLLNVPAMSLVIVPIGLQSSMLGFELLVLAVQRRTLFF